MKKSTRKLIVPREFYRLWFEFYKICQVSKDPHVISNRNASKTYYERWGDVVGQKFDDWWKSHGYLFSENQVRLLDDPEDRQSDQSLFVEIPLNQSTSSLLVALKLLIEQNRTKPKTKRKAVFTGSYQVTEGSEPKLKIIKSVLTIYRDVYLPNNRPKIPKLLTLVRQYYEGKKRMELPKSLVETNDNIDNVLRNLGRWMKWADQIVVNVSLGQFPGKY